MAFLNVAGWSGMTWRASIAVGAMIAMSSTAGVLRVLRDRGELDSVHGRYALGILLVQDIAVVPLVLLVTVLGGSKSGADVAWQLGRSALYGAGLVLVFMVVINRLLPRLLIGWSLWRNRELLLLLAVVTAIGSAWAAHALGLSAALGAFVAGVLLADSPFATQIRADIGGLRTLFVTLFFASIGMLGHPQWTAAHWPLVLATVAAVVVGKAAVAGVSVRLFGGSMKGAAAAGLCLGQIGEFSFMLAGVAMAERTESK